MDPFIDVGAASEMEDGHLKEVSIQGLNILLARVDDRYYAADNSCAHMGAKLSEGSLDGTVVTCPRHGSRFDLEGGHVVRWLRGPGLLSTIGRVFRSPRPIKTYPTRIEDGRILIEI